MPHLEVLPETSQGPAIDMAARLMAQRADAIRAEIWEDERLILSLPRELGAGPLPT